MGDVGDRKDLVSNRRHTSSPALRVIEEEPRWRHKPLSSAGFSAQRVIATRWRAFQKDTLQVQAESAPDCHVIGIALRKINIRLSFCGRIVQDGTFMSGMSIVNEPGLVIDGLLRGPTDVLHLHVPNDIIAECALHRAVRGTAVLASGVSPHRDPAVERLGMSLLAADELCGSSGRLFADYVSIAIVTKLIDTAGKSSPPDMPRARGLPDWCLRRVRDYIEGNLASPISLADLASVSGVTRMHFAAQFRAATGLRPHEYLLRCRIDRAQDLLRWSSEPIMSIALQVGFQTQAHFTSTFRRFVGWPPNAWRRAHS